MVFPGLTGLGQSLQMPEATRFARRRVSLYLHLGQRRVSLGVPQSTHSPFSLFHMPPLGMRYLLQFGASPEESSLARRLHEIFSCPRNSLCRRAFFRHSSQSDICGLPLSLRAGASHRERPLGRL